MASVTEAPPVTGSRDCSSTMGGFRQLVVSARRQSPLATRPQSWSERMHAENNQGRFKLVDNVFWSRSMKYRSTPICLLTFSIPPDRAVSISSPPAQSLGTCCGNQCCESCATWDDGVYRLSALGVSISQHSSPVKAPSIICSASDFSHSLTLVNRMTVARVAGEFNSAPTRKVRALAGIAAASYAPNDVL